jgi:hypothetical protein
VPRSGWLRSVHPDLWCRFLFQTPLAFLPLMRGGGVWNEVVLNVAPLLSWHPLVMSTPSHLKPLTASVTAFTSLCHLSSTLSLTSAHRILPGRWSHHPAVTALHLPPHHHPCHCTPVPPCSMPLPLVSGPRSLTSCILDHLVTFP